MNKHTTRVIIDLDESYAGVLSITAVASSEFQTRVSATAADVTKHNHLVLGADGQWTRDKMDGDSQ